MRYKKELLLKHTDGMTEVQKLEYIKKLISSAISSRKKLDKNLEKEFAVDTFNSSRAKRTTAYANSWKTNKVYYELIEDIKMSMSII